MLRETTRWGKATAALAAVALCASLFPGTAAAKQSGAPAAPSAPKPPAPIIIAPTVNAPTVNVNPTVTTSPSAAAVVNIATVPQIVVNAFNPNSTITIVNVAVICQQTANSCNGGG